MVQVWNEPVKQKTKPHPLQLLRLGRAYVCWENLMQHYSRLLGQQPSPSVDVSAPCCTVHICALGSVVPFEFYGNPLGDSGPNLYPIFSNNKMRMNWDVGKSMIYCPLGRYSFNANYAFPPHSLMKMMLKGLSTSPQLHTYVRGLSVIGRICQVILTL